MVRADDSQLMIARLEHVASNEGVIAVGRVCKGKIQIDDIFDVVRYYIYEMDTDGRPKQGAGIAKAKVWLRVIDIHCDGHELAEAEEGMVVGLELKGIGQEQLRVNEVLGGICNGKQELPSN